MKDNILISEIIGEGRPFIIMHGLFGMKDNWKTFAKDISKEGFEVHNLDMRNHGDSFHSEIHNYDNMSEDLENYISKNNIDKFHLLGHSMGGKTGMKYACNNSKKIEKLMIVDISPKYYAPHHKEILEALNEIDLSRIERRKDIQNFLQEKLEDLGVAMFLTKNIEKQGDDFRWKFNLKSITKNIEKVGEGLLEEEIFKEDTLFIRGENSDYIKNMEINILEKHFPNYKLSTISKAGHWVHAENHKDFYKEILNFIK